MADFIDTWGAALGQALLVGLVVYALVALYREGTHYEPGDR